jgi:hypothetical protein
VDLTSADAFRGSIEQTVCFNRPQYSVNYSLEHIQNVLSEQQFFRLNRQYLVNFNAVKEVEHYFARKLLVKLIVPVTEKLLVSKEKASGFFRWLENTETPNNIEVILLSNHSSTDPSQQESHALSVTFQLIFQGN